MAGYGNGLAAWIRVFLVGLRYTTLTFDYPASGLGYSALFNVFHYLTGVWRSRPQQGLFSICTHVSWALHRPRYRSARLDHWGLLPVCTVFHLIRETEASLLFVVLSEMMQPSYFWALLFFVPTKATLMHNLAGIGSIYIQPRERVENASPEQAQLKLAQIIFSQFWSFTDYWVNTPPVIFHFKKPFYRLFCKNDNLLVIFKSLFEVFITLHSLKQDCSSFRHIFQKGGGACPHLSHAWRAPVGGPAALGWGPMSIYGWSCP